MLDGLCQLQPTDDDSVYMIEIYFEHGLFKDHFPLYPILPGVLSIAIIRQCIESHFKMPFIIRRIDYCKFINPIRPNVENLFRVVFRQPIEIDKTILAKLLSHEDRVILVIEFALC